MGTRGSAEPAQTGHDPYLRELSDPEFFAYWAKARLSCAMTSKSSPEHPGNKETYDAALAEYRRRMDGS
jgi:hypothetical protein